MTNGSDVEGSNANLELPLEESYYQEKKTDLQKIGFIIERFQEFDSAGEVYWESPDQIEMDVAKKNGKLIALEIRLSVSKSNVYDLERKVVFYTRKTGRKVDRKLIVTLIAEAGARETGVRLGIEICTDINVLD